MSSGVAANAPLKSGRGLRATLSRLALPAVLALLVAALALVAVRTGVPEEAVDFDPTSAAHGGHKALWLWFAEQGYAVREIEGASFSIIREADLLILPPPRQPWTDAETTAVRIFLERGGTVAAFHPAAPALTEELGLAEPVFAQIGPQAQSQPLLPEAPAHWPGATGDALAPDRSSPAVTVLATAAGEPTVQVQAMGAGWLWELGPQHTLANGTLAENPDDVALATALLRTVPAGGLVLFDSYHLFGADDPHAVRTIQEWLYRTAAGRATLYLLLLGALYLLLAGRRLGPPLPAQVDVQRREAAEYVRAMAGLKRRAGALDETASHQRSRLKRELARSRGLAPGAAIGPAPSDDADFVRLLRHTAAVDEETIARAERLLARLQPPTDEATVIAAAAEIDALLGVRSAQAHPHSPPSPATSPERAHDGAGR